MTQTAEPEFDPQEFLPYLLNRAGEEAAIEFQALYKGRYGMLRTEWRVMFHLGEFGQLTAKEISTRARLHKTKVSRAIAKLAERRWLLRDRDDADRRMEHLALTTAGRAVYHDLRKQAAGYDRKLAEQFTAEEIALLRRMLKQLANAGEMTRSR